jgi:hypothetical protein
MDEQLTVDEIEYWMELEKLLARFHQDLERVRATLTAIGDTEVTDYLERAQFNVSAACCSVAHTVGVVSASVGNRT